MRIEEILSLAPVMPVVTIDEPAAAVPLARALLAGGLRAIEVTLRTAAALEASRLIAREAPEMVLGVGTVLSAEDFRAAAAAGAKFAVSPGLTPALMEASRAAPFPFLPGVASASELMFALEHGFQTLKFFPATSAGGPAALKALAGPFPSVRFCPTGGIDAANAKDYLALSNVACVGGSWVAPKEAMVKGDFPAIEALASAAAALR